MIKTYTANDKIIRNHCLSFAPVDTTGLTECGFSSTSSCGGIITTRLLKWTRVPCKKEQEKLTRAEEASCFEPFQHFNMGERNR